MKKFLGLALVLAVAVFVSSCGGGKSVDKGGFSAAMVTDVGGINDESFNQSAWAGMEKLKADLGISVSFIESHRASDYPPNLEKKVDESPNIIWGVGFMMKDAIRDAALANPEQLFALIDEAFADGELPNVISVVFNAEQSSFEVGYIAGYMTKTNHVGFVLGMEGPTMDRFKYGYFAGVQYAAKEQGKKIRVDFQVLESFDDTAKGKATALKMYTAGADIVYHAAGHSGSGVIEAAKEQNKMAIGVDLDQNALAPNNVITSALKNVGTGVYSVTKRVQEGEDLGGTTVTLGLAQDGVGIAPTSDKHVPSALLEKVGAIAEKIIDGAIIVPITDSGYKAFINKLK